PRPARQDFARVRHCPLPVGFAAGPLPPFADAQGDKGFGTAPLPVGFAAGPLPPFADAQGDKGGEPQRTGRTRTMAARASYARSPNCFSSSSRRLDITLRVHSMSGRLRRPVWASVRITAGRPMAFTKIRAIL